MRLQTRRALRAAVLSCVVSLGVASTASFALADLAAATAYVKEANELIGGNDFEKATSKLELAEAELDGVAAADAAGVKKQIEAARQKIAAASAAADKPKYQRKLARAMDDAEGAIGNLVIWGGAEDACKELFNDPAAKAALGDELAAAQKKFETFRKLHLKKAMAEYVGQVEEQVKQLEEQWKEAKAGFADPDISPNSKQRFIEKMGDAMESARKGLERLPADDEKAKAFAARIDAVSGEFAKIALADKAKEMVETLNRKIDLYKDDFDGWQQETKGVTWAEFARETSQKVSAFGAPKTIQYVERIGALLASLDQDEDYKLVAGAPEVKKIVDGLRANREAAVKKLVSFVTPVVDAADKEAVKDASDYGRLADAVRGALGEDSAEGKALSERIKKKVDAHEAATTGAEEAKVKLVATLRAKAEEVWPGLYAGMPYTTEIDLSNPGALVGKNIGFLADNLMGYRFKPGDFYYATTIGGIPVAAKIDPGIMAGIKATEAAIGRSLGDDDGDGKWDVIAVVTNQKAKLMARRQVEATGNIGGADVKLTGEYAEPVDAIVIEIVAAKCGPFAGVKGKGVLKTDGTVGKP